MQVHLNQTEIEQAITCYLRMSGIQIYGNECEILFKAGRKGTGLSAEISIEESDVPEFYLDETVYEAGPEVASVIAIGNGSGNGSVEQTRVDNGAQVTQQEEPIAVTTSGSLFG